MTKCRVLVVDHELNIADSVVAVLLDSGYDATASYDTKDAISVANSLKPELLIIEPVMPGISGVEAASRIAKEFGSKILFYTTLDKDRDFKDLLRGLRTQGCQCSAISKPAAPDQLIRHVTREIGPASPSSPTPDIAEDSEGRSHSTAQTSKEPEQYETILGICTADLYQQNAFRVTGLAMQTSLRDLGREVDKLAMAIKLGISQSPTGPFPLLMDSDRLGAALQVLKDPEKRVLHEFFWFWPCSEPGQPDPALKALQQKDYQRAVQIWETDRAGGQSIANHNLAVFYHLRALDLELGKTTRTEALWGSAYKHWNKLINHHGFWDKLMDRIRSFNDPRLNVHIARAMWASLPLGLLSISAQFAVTAASARDFEEAAKHRKLMQLAGFGEDLCRQALHRALNNSKQELVRLCNHATEEAYANPQQGAMTAGQLLNEKKPFLQSFNYLLGAGDPFRDGANDLVAQSTRSCLVAYVNQTESWENVRPLFEECLALAEGGALRAKLEEDLEIIATRIDAQKAERRAKAAANPHHQKTPEKAKAVPTSQPSSSSPAKAGGWVAASLLAVVVVAGVVRGCDDTPMGSSATIPTSPGSTNLSPTQPSYSQTPNPVFVSDPYALQRQQLNAEIEADKNRLDQLEMDLKASDNQLESFRTEIKADKVRLDQMKRDNDLGLNVDEVEYERVRGRHNGSVESYNNLLSEHNSTVAEYRKLLRETNLKIERYNSVRNGR